MKYVSIVGARPEFIQAWPVGIALNREHQEILVHTGQHYDYTMSQAFFDQLGIPAPNHNLGIGSNTHGKQTGEMLIALEQVLLDEDPEMVLVRGDTNSTLAGALAASKLDIPLVHIEAGERSYQRTMPEEINRIVADRLADLHLCASRTALGRLSDEGIRGSAYWVGDVMFDASRMIDQMGLMTPGVLQKLGVEAGRYSLVTVHRASNTDDDARLTDIVDILNGVGEPVVFPVHPRTRRALERVSANFEPHVLLLDPVGYLEISELIRSARLVATDSGGIQREAYFAAVPCLTLRDETEWTETVDSGWNRLAGTSPAKVLEMWFSFERPAAHPSIFGDGHAAERIAALINEWAGVGFSSDFPIVRQDELLPLDLAGASR